MASPDPLAALALSARLAIFTPVGTVQSHGQNPGQGRLPDPPWPAEEIGVADPVSSDGSSKSLGDVVLSGDLGKTPGSVLSG